VEFLQRAQDNGQIVSFYPLIARQPSKKLIPNDTLFANQWHLRNTGQSGGTIGADANVTPAWDSVTGSGIVIGVVDDGLQHTHPDLDDHYVAAHSFDFNDNDADPAPDPSIDWHGTAVAGVAAALEVSLLGLPATGCRAWTTSTMTAMRTRVIRSVAAVDHDGVQASYSEPGAPILVTAPSSGDGVGVVTTDILGSNGYNNTSGFSQDYTDSFGGTSCPASSSRYFSKSFLIASR
jgi:subtilisin family serine protease